jgi:hypothetical protein
MTPSLQELGIPSTAELEEFLKNPREFLADGEANIIEKHSTIAQRPIPI